MVSLLQNRDKGKLSEFGGPEGVVRLLASDAMNGLDVSTASLETRKETYGANELPARKGKSFFKLIWEQLKDATLILLMAAAMVSPLLSILQYAYSISCIKLPSDTLFPITCTESVMLFPVISSVHCGLTIMTVSSQQISNTIDI